MYFLTFLLGLLILFINFSTNPYDLYVKTNTYNLKSVSQIQPPCFF